MRRFTDLHSRGFVAMISLGAAAIGLFLPIALLMWGMSALACPGPEIIPWIASAAFEPWWANAVGNSLVTSHRKNCRLFQVIYVSTHQHDDVQSNPRQLSWKQAWVMGWLPLIGLPLLFLALVAAIEGISTLVPHSQRWHVLIMPGIVLLLVPFVVGYLLDCYVSLHDAYLTRLAGPPRLPPAPPA